MSDRPPSDDLTAQVTLRSGFLSEEDYLAAWKAFVGSDPRPGTFLEFTESQGLLSKTEAAAVRELIEGGRASPQAPLFEPTLQSQDPLLEPQAVVLPELAAGRYDFALGPGKTELELGRGGLGRVLAAHDLSTGRTVALKELLPLRTTPQVTARLDARFLVEARVTAQLEHPAIIPVYEIGRRPDGTIYYTMRRIQGRTLAATIAEAAPLAERLRLVRHVHTLALALAYAHERGVMHRDVKPQNVMLGPFGETWLLDWGLARHIVPSPGTEAVTAQDASVGLAPAAVGTPSYMSPELARGETDVRTDVFCLGAVLFEVLTRTPPRTAPTVVEAVVLARTTPVPLVRSLAPEVAPELAAICDRALAFSPDQRYQSTAALAGDLDAWLQGRTVGTYEYSARELLRRFASRHRAVLSVAAAAVLTLGLVLTLAGLRVQREAEESRRFAQLLMTDVSEQLSPVPGSLPLLREITTRATEHFARAGRLESLGLEDRAKLANAWVRLARLQLDLGDLEGFPATKALLTQLVPPISSPFDPREPMAVLSVTLPVLDGSSAWLQGDNVRAKALLEAGERAVDEGLASGTRQIQWLVLQQQLHRPLGRLEDDFGTTEGALRHYRITVEALEKLRRLNPDPSWDLLLVDASMDLAIRQQGTDRGLAVATAAHALEVARALPNLATDPGAASSCGSALRQYAELLRAGGRIDEARPLEQEALGHLENALRLEPSSMEAVVELGDLALQSQDFAGAARWYRRADGFGLGNDVLSALLASELFAGNPQAVIARRGSVVDTDFEQTLLLGLALLATRQTDEGIAVLERLERLSPGTFQYAPGAITALGQRLGGPVGAELELLGADFDAAVVGVDPSQDQFVSVARSMPKRLRAASAK